LPRLRKPGYGEIERHVENQGVHARAPANLLQSVPPMFLVWPFGVVLLLDRGAGSQERGFMYLFSASSPMIHPRR
jgi:hypothetical protein